MVKGVCVCVGGGGHFHVPCHLFLTEIMICKSVRVRSSRMWHCMLWYIGNVSLCCLRLRVGRLMHHFSPTCFILSAKLHGVTFKKKNIGCCSPPLLSLWCCFQNSFYRCSCALFIFWRSRIKNTLKQCCVLFAKRIRELLGKNAAI